MTSSRSTYFHQLLRFWIFENCSFFDECRYVLGSAPYVEVVFIRIFTVQKNTQTYQLRISFYVDERAMGKDNIKNSWRTELVLIRNDSDSMPKRNVPLEVRSRSRQFQLLSSVRGRYAEEESEEERCRPCAGPCCILKTAKTGEPNGKR
jgi:hypothetical protein